MMSEGNAIGGMAAFLANEAHAIDLNDENSILKALRDAGYPGSEIKAFAARAADLARELQKQ